MARDALIAGGGSGQAGASRAALLIAGAVIAAVLVLAAGALRSGPVASAPPATGTSGAVGSLGVASLPPVPTAAPPDQDSPSPPDSTAIPGPRGEYVGALGLVETCPVLYLRSGLMELILPDAYRSRVRGGQVQLLEAGGAVLAFEGDLLGIDGRVREGGSRCMAGPQLHVSEIVEVVHRAPE